MPVALTALDIVVFITSVIVVMGVGLWSGRRERGTEDFFLAGRSVPWWAVAGSIFGTNVSANHLVGMMGIGYSVGFAQSHFELGAIAGLMLLCYGFLPLYRRMGVYTLSEYLGRRYDERSRVLYSLIAMIVITLIQMVAAFYIGSRAMNLLLRDTPLELGYANGIAVLALVSGAYTIFGGLKAVIWTDVIQSFLLLAAGIFVAALVFSQPEIGGLTGLIAKDAALPAAEQKFHLYLPPDHPDLPWTGALTGLMVLHFFYWGTNQFIVQRALAARSRFDGRMGIVAAGYFKLLIPFFAIGGGIAAGHLFQARLDTLPQPDDAFPMLVRLLVPVGYGLAGLITAGLVGAILSSIDSMMNSGATLFTFDFYKRFFRKDAGERELLWVGRIAIAAFIVVAGVLATVFYTEKDEENFFLRLVDQTSHLVPGVLVAFLAGILWRGATATGSFAAILLSPFYSVLAGWSYEYDLVRYPLVREFLGSELNFLHRAAVTALFAWCVLIVVSLLTKHTREREREQYVWWEYRRDPEEGSRLPFWRSERPWAILLCGLAIWMMIYFA